VTVGFAAARHIIAGVKGGNGMPGVRTALLAVLPLLGLAGPEAVGAQPVEVDAEIVLAVDTSGSVDTEERRIQRQGYAEALRHAELMRAVTAGFHGQVAFSYFEWAGHIREATVIPWHVVDGPEAAAVLAGKIESLTEPATRGTSLSRALDFAIGLIEGSGFDASKRVIDISGDGPNNTGPPVVPQRDRAVAAGITVNGLPVLVRPSRGFSQLDRYFEDCVIGGEGAFVLAVRTDEELGLAIRRKMVMEISGPGPERLRLATDHEPMDCMIGERQRPGFIERY
jgi:uncharacterized protein DUF1194